INIEGKYVQCEVCRIDLLPATTYYSCNKCRFSRTKAYHKEYIEPIPEHPYHPKHSLRLVSNYRHIYDVYFVSVHELLHEIIHVCVKKR
ncbi:unnamed protein product, partial [Brassica oleracea var. botrytis]